MMSIFVVRLVTMYDRSVDIMAIVNGIRQEVNNTAATRWTAAMRGSEFAVSEPLAQADIAVQSLHRDRSSTDVPDLEAELVFHPRADRTQTLNFEPFAEVLTTAFIATVGAATRQFSSVCERAGITEIAVGARLPRAAGVDLQPSNGRLIRSWGLPNRTGGPSNNAP